jgi:REP element-mobilizing transposase RayT
VSVTEGSDWGRSGVGVGSDPGADIARAEAAKHATIANWQNRLDAFLTNREVSGGASRGYAIRMGRAKRIQTPGLIRHVMSRGNGRMEIFLDDRDYRKFMQLLADVVEDFELECWNYCVMPNHYHATIRPTLPNISAALQQLNGDYAKWFNWRYTRVGHAFQGRFKAQIVEREGYSLTLARYVALNPVRAKLVERPEDWPWSSYASTIGLRPISPFLSADATLALFGEGDRSTLQKRFADFVLARCDDTAAHERIRSNSRILGSVAFKRFVRAGRVEGASEASVAATAEGGQTGVGVGSESSRSGV